MYQSNILDASLAEVAVKVIFTSLTINPMLPALQQSFDRMEKARLALLQGTERLTEEQAHRQPGPEQWSVVQVVEHLVTSESSVLRIVQKQIAKSTLRPAGLSAKGRFILLTLMLRYKKKIKAPAVLAPPTGDRSLEQWLHDWETLRQQWCQLLDSVPPELLQKEVFKHPIAGFLTLEQTLRFVAEHCNHHVAQVRRLIGYRY